MTEDEIIKLAKTLRLEWQELHTHENVLVQCPFAPYVKGHKGIVDHSPSMSISVSEFRVSKFNCFGCGHAGEDVYGLLMQLEDLGYRDKERLHQAFEIVNSAEDRMVGMHDTYEDAVAAQHAPIYGFSRPEEIEVYDDNILNDFPATDDSIEFMLRRGISREVQQLFELGFDATKQRVTFPARWRDKGLVGMIGRTVADAHPKYWNYWNFPKSTLLYGESQLRDDCNHVIIVEGPIDVLRLVQAGFDALATLGTSISDRQVSKLAVLERTVVLFFDGDGPGDKARNKVAAKLAPLGVDVRKVRPESGKDAGDYSDDELKAILTPVIEPLGVGGNKTTAPMMGYWNG